MRRFIEAIAATKANTAAFLVSFWRIRLRHQQYVVCFHPFRCGSGIQNRQPQHLTDHHPHYPHLKRPQPARRSPYASPYLRVSRRPWDGAWKEQWGACGTPRPSTKRATRPQKDQSREWVFFFGGAAPDFSFRKWPFLRHHHNKSRKNLQVRKDVFF